jgi:hypothetical protein
MHHRQQRICQPRLKCHHDRSVLVDTARCRTPP